MKYRIDNRANYKLSVLGLGCMRFPRGLNGKIDIDKSEKLVISAIDAGINYFDAGYTYPGVEQALGEALKRNPGAREKIYIATKLPHMICKTYEDFDRIFNAQLKRLNTDYIDYYLLHYLSSMSDWHEARKLGIEEWIAQKKASGLIRQTGFSFHGMQSEFLALLDEYDWDLCMIQYNYMNENYQAGRKGLLRAHDKGLPVVVMEPLLGGKLATGLPQKAVKLFKNYDNNLAPADWALHWLWNHKEITVLLSGMNSEEQLNANAKTAEMAKAGMMTKQEIAVIAQVVEIIKRVNRIPCTECNYCLPCPREVNIPGSFAAYNMSYSSGFIAGLIQYIIGTSAIKAENSYSGRNCLKCGKCEKQCPQNIEIIRSLEKVLKRMEPFWYKTAVRFIDENYVKGKRG